MIVTAVHSRPDFVQQVVRHLGREFTGFCRPSTLGAGPSSPHEAGRGGRAL